VRLLLDENLSPLVCGPLIASGHDAVHVRDLGLSGAPDRVVLERADQDGRVVISSDTDFGQLLARPGASAPSVIMFRREEHRRAAAQASLILANLEQVGMISKPASSWSCKPLGFESVGYRSGRGA
jgi:predicted nuclease of predicted toxin-antitoxin system